MPQISLAISFKRNLFLVVIYSFFLGYLTHRLTRPSPRVHYERDTTISTDNPLYEPKVFNNSTPRTRALVIYAYGETHPSAPENLAFFIRTAVHASHDADYYFILQQIRDKVFDTNALPPLPSNAHYIQHEDKCFDLGTVGWLLSTGRVDKNKYKYFIFLNSSVRGPFIVAYYHDPVWYTIFTRRLNDYIRLVGCTFSCEVFPHIQSYLWAMNLETFDFLLNNTMVFTCHRSMQRTVRKGEIGASRALLRAGYGIESLMTKYRGLDLRVNFLEECPYKYNPATDNVVDGVTLDPYEVVFVKVKAGNSLYQSNLDRTIVYKKWLDG